MQIQEARICIQGRLFHYELLHWIIKVRKLALCVYNPEHYLDCLPNNRSSRNILQAACKGGDLVQWGDTCRAHSAGDVIANLVSPLQIGLLLCILLHLLKKELEFVCSSVVKSCLAFTRLWVRSAVTHTHTFHFIRVWWRKAYLIHYTEVTMPIW